MKAALTGTPGTGKTSAASRVEGIKVASVVQLAEEAGATAGIDPETGSLEIDIALLSKAIAGMEGDLLIEGHLSHLLGADLAVVLRCSPRVLRERLLSRGYGEAKVDENVEAEAVDVIVIEAVEAVPVVCEIDATHLSPANVAAAITEILAGESEKYPVGHVDWSQEVLDWF